MISIQPLTEEAFAPFGKAVIQPAGGATAADETFSFWSDVASYGIDGETEVGYCTVYRGREDVVDWMERHDRTPEMLLPIGGPFVLPVMANDGAVQAFHVDVGQAVVIGDSVWHSACKPVGADEVTYFVVFRRGTPSEDVIKQTIDPVTITRDAQH